MNRIIIFATCLFLQLPVYAGDAQVIGVPGLDSLMAGEMALHSGQYAEGIRHTLTGLQLASSPRIRSKALNNLCAGYVGAGDYAAALKACDQALATGSRSWRTYSNRALAHLYMRRLGSARLDLEQALRLNPQSPTLSKIRVLLNAKVREFGEQADQSASKAKWM
ncbi:MAG: tetratricopeptide repeat protein [Gammaproteobacteria bacterium]|nr:tetratricopeptide repeat protein [Gammaproteobacteria bacterium]